MSSKRQTPLEIVPHARLRGKPVSLAPLLIVALLSPAVYLVLVVLIETIPEFGPREPVQPAIAVAIDPPRIRQSASIRPQPEVKPVRQTVSEQKRNYCTTPFTTH